MFERAKLAIRLCSYVVLLDVNAFCYVIQLYIHHNNVLILVHKLIFEPEKNKNDKTTCFPTSLQAKSSDYIFNEVELLPLGCER